MSMNIDEFRDEAHKLVDWMVDYLRAISDKPVKAQVKPGEVLKHLPLSPPERAESFEKVFGDFERIIMPGMTHWQHPSFFAYFPANSSLPSLLGEMLTSTLAAQCMSWQTSPAATELEQCVTGWLRQMLGLPSEFTGVIQDTASTATLCSLLTAREKGSDYEINRYGFARAKRYTVYCSTETHSSIEKAVKIAGFGAENLRKVTVDDKFAMVPAALESAVTRDLEDGCYPLAVVATLGTTGSTAVDPLQAIGEICHKRQLWLHVDAAYAGTALLLPEMRWMSKGMEYADSFVFNPHKWMLTNFDCSTYFVKDTGALIRAFEILPEYLKTAEGQAVNNYRDWGIQLGRRFRALKLWFVIRIYGVEGLREVIRKHIDIAQKLRKEIEAEKDFEMLAPSPLNLLCFRYHPNGVSDETHLNTLNERLLEAVNATGKTYITHTKLNGKYALRMVIGQTNVEYRHAKEGWELIKKLGKKEM